MLVTNKPRAATTSDGITPYVRNSAPTPPSGTTKDPSTPVSTTAFSDAFVDHTMPPERLGCHFTAAPVSLSTTVPDELDVATNRP